MRSRAIAKEGHNVRDEASWPSVSHPWNKPRRLHLIQNQVYFNNVGNNNNIMILMEGLHLLPFGFMGYSSVGFMESSTYLRAMQLDLSSSVYTERFL